MTIWFENKNESPNQITAAECIYHVLEDVVESNEKYGHYVSNDTDPSNPYEIFGLRKGDNKIRCFDDKDCRILTINIEEDRDEVPSKE